MTNQLLCQLSYTSAGQGLFVFGASGRNRTTDTGIFSPLLYRLSYRGRQNNKTFENTCRKASIFIGDPEGARTLDLQRDRLAY